MQMYVLSYSTFSVRFRPTLPTNTSKALVTAQVDTESHIRETAASVKGMMFLGTPHAGSDKQKWADIGTSCVKFFKDDVNKEVLEILAKDSTMLAHLGEEFPRYLQLRNQKQQDGLNEAGGKIEVICYFEENKSMVGVVSLFFLEN